MNTKNTKRGRNKGSTGKHDWPAIRQDFVRSDFKTVKEWLLARGYPEYWVHQPKLHGIVKERAQYKDTVLMEAADKNLQEDIKDSAKILQRQARLGRFMQLKGAEALNRKDMKIDQAEDARKLLVSGLEQERKALGLEGGKNLTQININTGPKTNLDKYIETASYEELIGLIAELKRLRAGHPTEKTLNSGSGEIEEGEVV